MSAPYGTFVDPQINPIANQGAVMAAADYDVGAKIATQLENREIGPSAYSGADTEQAWNIAPDDLLFTVPGKHGSQGDIKLAVLPTLNGLGAAATARYAAEPDGLAMIRECVKNQIVYVGAAYQDLSSERGQVERGIAVQMAGLKTLHMGNNQFGDERDTANFIKPGDILSADVPVPGRDGLSPGVGGRLKKGVPMNKFTLQLRRRSPHSAGHSLRRHIREIVRDARRWKVSMGEHLAGTRMWASAANATVRSYLTSGVLFVRELMRAGVLTVSDAAVGLGANTDEQAKLTNARNAVNNNGGFAVGNTRVVEVGADSFALHLAQLYGIIPKVGADLTAGLTHLRANNVTKTFAGRVLTLPGKTINSIFYDGTNQAFQFGFMLDGGAGIPTSTALVAGTGYVNDETPAGQMLLRQLNHFPEAVSAFDGAIQRDWQFVVGKATTGASSYGSGKCNVFLGKYH